MALCPFCKEEIKDDAIKCKHCASSLLPPQGDNKDSRQTVYVVDQDLVRFGKFAVAVIAILATIGVIFFGVDIKQSVEKAAEIQDSVREKASQVDEMRSKALDSGKEIKDAIQQMSGAIKEMNTAKGSMETDRKDVDLELAEARKDIDEMNSGLKKIKETQTNSDAMAAKIDASRKDVETKVAQLESLLEKGQGDVADFERIRDAMLKGSKPITSDSATANSRTGATSSPSSGPYTALELARLYNFPIEYGGAGQTIGLVELGGGYSQSDLKSYFDSLNLPIPEVTAVSVDGTKNSPSTAEGSAGSADYQVTSDIEIVGAIAPRAKISVYFSQDIATAISQALHEDHGRPNVIVVCWGAMETVWGKSAEARADTVFSESRRLGVTILAASGDNGSSDGGTGNNVDFPAASQWVLAVGGSQISVKNGAIGREESWNGTGGGFSNNIPLPVWQRSINFHANNGPGPTGRGAPDVSANANPSQGYKVYIHGRWNVVGGTSMATCLWGGLITILNQALGKPIGFFNEILYERIGPSGALREVTEGNNGSYSAGPGWNPVTGWGSPDGRKLLAALQGLGSSK